MYEGPLEAKQFSSPEEEIQYLRKQIAEREQTLSQHYEPTARQEVVREQVRAYAETEPHQVLSEAFRMKAEEIEDKVLRMKPGHGEKMEELMGVAQEKGIRNAISVVERLNNPHLEDDFHRFLVQYFVEMGSIPGVKEGTPLFKALNKKLFEVRLLRKSADEVEGKFAELIRSMEQFYAGMLSISGQSGTGTENFTIEIAQSNNEEDVVFYCAVPRASERLFEKQLLGVFPEARVIERKDDFNIFTDGGTAVASYGIAHESAVLPLKTYKEFEQDPLAVLLHSFSRIKKEGEGAAIQFVIRPAGERYTKEYRTVLEKVQEGTSLKEATQSIGMTIAKEFGGTLKDIMFGAKTDANKEEKESPKIDEDLVENIKGKIGAPIVETNIRLVASAKEEHEAVEILRELEASFNQFTKSNGNGITFKRASGKTLSDLLHAFSFRTNIAAHAYPLNLEELTTLFHFPKTAQSGHELREDKAKQAPVAATTEEGILLGVNEFQGSEKEIRFGKEDRVRHLYVIGQTGTGKTVFLKNMIIQDIENGDGVCMIDPHGSDIEDVLAQIPENRIDDVIYFDPAYTARPMALNMLEYDTRYPEQKTFVVNELFSIFKKLYGGSPESMGPMFEQYFRNATMLVVEDPATGNTLLEVSRVMSDEAFRKLKLSRCGNPLVKQFWEKVATQAGGEASLANIVPYITSKFDVFMANDFMRPIIAQERSSFNFRKIMDERKILLVNLAKGRLGDINASLLGLIIVGKILMAALSRVDAAADQRPDFYLYIDEFQNVTTDSIATILSEARKYRLGLIVAHQFIAQLEETIKNAVFGNIGSKAVFRVSSEDAQFLESQFTPSFSASDLMNVENYHAFLKMLINGYPHDAFNIRTLPPKEGLPDVIEKFKQLSYYKYGADRAAVEASIAKRFKT